MASEAGPASRRFGPYPRFARSRWLIAACWAFVFVAAFFDLTVVPLNLTVFYLVPLSFLLMSGRERWAWLAAAVTILLTYAVHIDQVHGFSPETWRQMADYRLLDRTFVAVAILAITAFYRSGKGTIEELKTLHDDMEDGRINSSDEITLAYLESRNGVVAIVLALGLFVLDIFSPRNVNVAILYVVPVLGAFTLRSRWVLVTVVAITLVASGAGYYLGPMSTVLPEPPSVALNRVVTALTVLLVGATSLFWLRAERAGR
jgi:hypothetical protein